jgi:transposase-like protein
MAGKCSVCELPDRAAVDDALVSGTPYRDIARRHESSRLTISALSRHRRAHLSPALKAVVVEREQAGAVSALDRFEDLYREASSILSALKVDGNSGRALQAVQVLAGVVEKIARITGELDDRPTVQVLNVQSSPEWLTLRATLLGVLDRHPQARAEVVAALSESTGLTA